MTHGTKSFAIVALLVLAAIGMSPPAFCTDPLDMMSSKVQTPVIIDLSTDPSVWQAVPTYESDPSIIVEVASPIVAKADDASAIASGGTHRGQRAQYPGPVSEVAGAVARR